MRRDCACTDQVQQLYHITQLEAHRSVHFHMSLQRTLQDPQGQLSDCHWEYNEIFFFLILIFCRFNNISTYPCRYIWFRIPVPVAVRSASDTRCSAEVCGRRLESLPLPEIESGILPIERQSLRGALNTRGRVCFEDTRRMGAANGETRGATCPFSIMSAI